MCVRVARLLKTHFNGVFVHLFMMSRTDCLLESSKDIEEYLAGSFGLLDADQAWIYGTGDCALRYQRYREDSVLSWLGLCASDKW